MRVTCDMNGSGFGTSGKMGKLGKIVFFLWLSAIEVILSAVVFILLKSKLIKNNKSGSDVLQKQSGYKDYSYLNLAKLSSFIPPKRNGFLVVNQAQMSYILEGFMLFARFLGIDSSVISFLPENSAPSTEDVLHFKKRMSFKSQRDLNMSPNNNLTRMLHRTGTFTYMDGLSFVGSMWVTDFPPHHIPPEKSSTFTKIRFLPLEAPFQIPRQLL